MALSDSCFEFMQQTADAANVLSVAIHHYAAPDYPISYGIEIDALRRACAAVKERPFDPEAGAELLRLAASVMTFHDTMPPHCRVVSPSSRDEKPNKVVAS
jgi:hypothetical protein